ncbi:STAS domain-containing protein [Streptomyces sp. M54]|uniref:STAS domain-containing protein n=1 Tax=Streptomyces sp. M54 TaxID=2759525 RepID=UPI001A8FF8EF|nr:STAS domain-containing protein [Streptomyces sp. M54]QSS95531.1 STAS domain-containing protein [Streptomyces sp. M54]
MTDERQPHATEIPPDMTVLRFRGDLDFEDASSLAEAIQGALAENPRVLAIDVSAITFADSSMLRALVETQQHIEDKSGTMVLVGPITPPMRRLLEITATDELFTIVENMSQAMTVRLPGSAPEGDHRQR